jgi:hypothetical protein
MDRRNGPDPTPELLRRLAAHGIDGQVGTDSVMIDVAWLRCMVPVDVRPMLDAVLQDLCTALDRKREE